MNGPSDQEAIARAILDANRYMTFATADEPGTPWASSVSIVLRSMSFSGESSMSMSGSTWGGGRHLTISDVNRLLAFRLLLA
jgi:hypothetical protein